MLWLPLILVIITGIGVGLYFLRETPASPTTSSPTESNTEVSGDYHAKTVYETMNELDSIKGLATYLDPSTISVFEADASRIVFFAPSDTAIQNFSKDTGVLPVKVMPYHIVLGETTDPVVQENTRLKTENGQELTIIKKDANLYVRDAKGNDVRLRKPIEAKNGKVYIIDKVLLTQ